MVDAPPDQEWLRKPEAAVRLGISERAIDMQVRAGKLPRRARPDGKVEVLVPKAPETVQAERGLELVERYEQRVEALVTRLTAPILEQLAQAQAEARAQAEAKARAETEVAHLREQLLKLQNGSARRWWAFWQA